MRDKKITEEFYIHLLGFRPMGSGNYPEYLMVEKDQVELHFFLFPELNPLENYGQVYIRTSDIKGLYREFLDRKVPIHPNGPLQAKPWGQMEFSVLDPDHNLLTFGQAV
ncbi:VOC family protein [Algoriphagus taiwanensis]|uniref:Bleomycin resistance protein n=2 Tax=Algoriphagus taiwanensis TaxID=1445656 RepID=A0ABQ6PXB0_9BACT|nr:VOC family protein [Algoriphagus taiwanensis]